jgi:hypothetical protein
MHIFPYQFQEKRYQTLVHHANYHPREKNKPSRGVHHFTSSIHQEITQKKFARERDLLTAYSARGQLMYHEVFIYVPDMYWFYLGF